jgi:hypothetical protein
VSAARKRWVAFVAAGAAAVALGGVAAARRGSTPRPVLSRGVELHVPHAPASIVLDGDVDDPGWRGPGGRTRALVTADGSEARPYSDARLVWGDGQLYVALYAADQDIVATYSDPDSPLWLEDAFELRFSDGVREESIDVSPRGVVTDAARTVGGPLDYAWSSGAHVSRELDGTMNDSRDDDEEWLLEMAIPLEALGLEGKPGDRVELTLRRCDTPKHAPKHASRVCSAWNGVEGGTLVLD